MKTMILPLSLVFCLLATGQEAIGEVSKNTYAVIKTLKDKEYLEVVVTKVEPDGLRVKHQTGLAKIRFEDLPEEFHTKYGYDPEAGAIFSQEQDAKELARLKATDAAMQAAQEMKQEQEELVKDEGTENPEEEAKEAGPIRQAKLFAQTTSMGRTADRSWETSWGSYDETIFRGRAVTCTVNVPHQGEFTIDIYWIGRGVIGDKSQQIASTHSKRFSVTRPEQVKQEFAALFVENDTKYAALRIRERSGVKYVGWVVRVVNAAGETIAVQGSRPPLIDFVVSSLR